MPTIPKPKPLPWVIKTPKRQGSNQEYYGKPAHRKQSIAYRKANPICEVCSKKGIARPVIQDNKRVGVMDHIIPIENEGSKTDLRNIMSMCSYRKGSCHDKKRSLESRQIFVKSERNERGNLVPVDRLEIIKLLND